MRFLLTMALFGLTAVSFAQDPADIFHKTVDVDEINSISFDVYANDQLEFKTWPGDDVLIETSVRVNNVEPRVLEFYMRQNRYVLEPEVSGDQMSLVSKDKKRFVVKGTEDISSEDVVIVIYLPETFEAAGENRFQRKSR